LAMMSRFDFNWVSDNTDPVDRIFIQDSYLTLFPANTMISWVTQEDWHQQNPSLEFKFDVCMAGVLGVGYDITKWDVAEKKIASKKIAQYKSIREIVQKGDVYRIVSPYENTHRSVLQYVDKNKTNAVIFAYHLAEYQSPHQLGQRRQSLPVKLRGLIPDIRYSIEGMEESYSGRYLMDVGISLPLQGAYKSNIFVIKSVE